MVSTGNQQRTMTVRSVCVCARVTICYCAADPVFDRLGDDGQVDKEQKR